MKKAIVLSIFCSLFISIRAPAFEIKDEWITPPGEYENRDIPFILNKAGVRIALPIRSLYTVRVFNQAHTLAAINYHETTDYDGADLVVSNGKKISILQDVLHLIETTAERKKILPVQPWDRIEFTVKSILGNKAHCVFRGYIFRTNTLVERQFDIIVGSSDNPLDLQIIKK